MSAHEKPYSGTEQRLILSFDIGTTHSGVSYCILKPGEVPKIHSVTRYPGQEHAAGSPKIPTVLYYDANGSVRAVGAEAFVDETVERAEDEHWDQVNLFKLRMSPSTFTRLAATSHLSVPPLPPFLSIIEILGDLLAYLLSCAENFIQETHPAFSARDVWEILRLTAKLVITHPDSWNFTQRSILTQAAVHAGIIGSSSIEREQIIFVPEGEADLYYCLRNVESVKVHSGYIIADLGGGTLDFSAYAVSGDKPLRFGDFIAPHSDLEGSIAVTERARAFFTSKLRGSVYGIPESIELITKRFDETTKCAFRGVEESWLVHFGSPQDNDAAYGIRSGKLKLRGDEIASLFEPALQACINAVASLLQNTFVEIETVYIVGGFSANPYVNTQLAKRLSPFGIRIVTPDGQLNKSTSEGSISLVLEQYIFSRVTRVTYLFKYQQTWNPNDPEHAKRGHLFKRLPNGAHVASRFSILTKSGASVKDEYEFLSKFHDIQTHPDLISDQTLTIVAYRGIGEVPHWADEVVDKGTIRNLGELVVERDLLVKLARATNDVDGNDLWRYDIGVVLRFGGPQLKAFYWYEYAGKKKRSKSQVIFYDAFD